MTRNTIRRLLWNPILASLLFFGLSAIPIFGGNTELPPGFKDSTGARMMVFPLDSDFLKQAFSPGLCDFVVKKSTYTVCYDKRGKIAKWDSYILDGNLVDRTNIKSRPEFYPEFSLPKKYRAYPSDYSRSGFDRGHLRPDAATDWDPVALNTTYSMVNIVPQRPMLNRKMWSKAERFARMAAVRLGKVRVLNIMEFKKGFVPRSIGRHRIAVPSGFYKVISDIRGNPVRCFYYQNMDYSRAYAERDRLKNHLVECSQIDLAIAPSVPRKNSALDAEGIDSYVHKAEDVAKALWKNRHKVKRYLPGW